MQELEFTKNKAVNNGILKLVSGEDSVIIVGICMDYEYENAIIPNT